MAKRLYQNTFINTTNKRVICQDNALFFDMELQLEDPMDRTIYEKIGISKILLAQNSSFFERLFMKSVNKKYFVLEVKREDRDILHEGFEFLYVKNFPLEKERCLKLYEFGLQYDVIDVFINCPMLSLTEITHLFIGVGTFKFEPSKKSKKSWKVKQLFHVRASEIIRSIFNSINVIFVRKQEYISLDLPSEPLK